METLVEGWQIAHLLQLLKVSVPPMLAFVLVHQSLNDLCFLSTRHRTGSRNVQIRTASHLTGNDIHDL